MLGTLNVYLSQGTSGFVLPCSIGGFPHGAENTALDCCVLSLWLVFLKHLFKYWTQTLFVVFLSFLHHSKSVCPL